MIKRRVKQAARLTSKFDRAVQFAIRAHRGQIRKGSGAPYISHPIAVSSLVMEYGGNETQAIGALLHDVIEDCGVKATDLDRRFGARVARIVVECSDYVGPPGAKKPLWRRRKEDYIAHVSEAHVDTLLISVADKLHNARCIVHDVNHYGASTWKRFNASPTEILWYYQSLLKAFRKRKHKPISTAANELEVWVKQMAKIVGR